MNKFYYDQLRRRVDTLQKSSLVKEVNKPKMNPTTYREAVLQLCRLEQENWPLESGEAVVIVNEPSSPYCVGNWRECAGEAYNITDYNVDIHFTHVARTARRNVMPL